MNFTFATTDAAKTAGDLLILPLFETDVSDRKKPPAALASVDKKLKGLLHEAATEEGFKGKAEQSFVLHTHGKLPVPRVLLLGLGAKGRFQSEVLRMAAGRAVKTAHRLHCKNILFALPEGVSELPALAQAVCEGLIMGAYRFDRYRTTSKEDKKAPAVAKVQFLMANGQKKDRAVDAAISLGRKVAEATNWARDLVNEPAAIVTPNRLAEEAKSLAKDGHLECDVFGREQIEKLKMGMFLGVTQGSAEEPRLIHLRYIPKNEADAKKPCVALVGKAITFDSGGLSLKTADGMVDMKTDMAGSAAVLGAMKVIAALKPPFPVHAFMGACENMPSGTAYRPGDILVSRLGKTVEITNTDAEGRLVLGDVLAWANEHNAGAIIDLATLTGACMVALGHYITGAFGDDEGLVSEVLEAGKATGEELWRLPIFPMQMDTLKSDVADMKNSGERWGGAINAAVFLKEFVGKTPWVHLDIAGPSQSPKDRGYYTKGATGVGVRTLVELVRRRSEAPTRPEAKD